MTLKGIFENVLANIIAAAIASTPMAEPRKAHQAEHTEPVVYEQRRSSKGSVEADLSWISVTVEWERSVESVSEREDEK